MRQCDRVRGDTIEGYMAEYNKFNRKLEKLGYKFIEHQILGPTEAIIYYDQEIEIEQGLCCADCENYQWGTKCLCTNEKRGPKDEACELFNVEIKGVQS